MRKFASLTMFFAMLYGMATAQNTNVFRDTGYVGIGTLAPTARLSFNDINDGSNIANGITWYSGDPLAYGIYRTPGTWVAPDFQQLRINWKAGILINPGDQFGKSYLEVTGGGLRVTSGNVIIGKTSQINTTYKLDVNGNVRANRIVVNATGADFVFDPAYNLLSLEEIKRFIHQNKHLPEVPSAKEMQAEGINVGDLEIKLLQKIEELTLHVIKQQEEIDALKKAILKQDK